ISSLETSGRVASVGVCFMGFLPCGVGAGFTPARAPIGAGFPSESRTIVRPRRRKAGAYTIGQSPSTPVQWLHGFSPVVADAPSCAVANCGTHRGVQNPGTNNFERHRRTGSGTERRAGLSDVFGRRGG